MTPKLSGNQCGRFLVAVLLATTAAGIFFHAQDVSAMPRAPLPPIPGMLRPIWQESFDEYYFPGETNAQLSISGLGLLDESWSGYALNRTGDVVIPFTVPALDSTGYTNFTSDTASTVRFWFRPDWSSQSLANGTGPGANAVLLECDAASGGVTAYAWSLEISPDGNTLRLLAQTDTGIATNLETSIAWEPWKSHCVVLGYSGDGSALYVDGLSVATGSSLPSIPPSVGELTFGSSASGTNPGEGDIDECYSFDGVPTDANVAMYYQMTSNQAALGPERRHRHRGSGAQKDSIHSLGNVYDPDADAGCSTGGPFYMTNFAATLQTNGTTTVNFDIYGGTNGVFYDIFTTSSLNNSLASNQWLWIGQGLACNSYTFTNQPADQSFYELELPAETFTISFGGDDIEGDNNHGQLNAPQGLTNAIAVAVGGDFAMTLRNDGTILAWGNNQYGETNVPAGLSNVVGIAAGYRHGVAVLADGSVTNWGNYLDYYGNYFSVTNYSQVSAPPTSNVVSVAAGEDQDLALLSNGTVYAWGANTSFSATVPTNLNLTNVTAIACGQEFNVALSSNGTVTAWGYSDPLFGYPTNIPGDLTTNVAAIAAGGDNGLVLLKNGTVGAWGDGSGDGDSITNVPTDLSNVVAISTGGVGALALQVDGTVVAWGFETMTNIPVGVVGAKAICSGLDLNLIIESGQLAPVIFTQPTDQSAVAGGAATFSVAAEGFAGVQYQWQFDGVDLPAQRMPA
jgi:alpha-tubulin suppressor-like RCC1 family protein